MFWSPVSRKSCSVVVAVSGLGFLTFVLSFSGFSLDCSDPPFRLWYQVSEVVLRCFVDDFGGGEVAGCRLGHTAHQEAYRSGVGDEAELWTEASRLFLVRIPGSNLLVWVDGGEEIARPFRASLGRGEGCRMSKARGFLGFMGLWLTTKLRCSARETRSGGSRGACRRGFDQACDGTGRAYVILGRT